MNISLEPIAFVKNSRKNAIDDDWEGIVSHVELVETIPIEAFDNISEFTHLEIIFYFDQAKSEDVVFSGHPRGNRAYPKMGIFAQRKKDRPNHLGLCTVQLLEHKDKILKVKYLDAIDGTPILDIKPVFKEFQPRGEIHQPVWVNDLMRQYW